MTLSQPSLLRRAADWLHAAASNGAVILLYHRVAQPDVDPWELAVSPEHFAEHMEILRRAAQPLSLADMRRALAAGGLPPRAVVVTFDDGYADNLTAAKPLLERHEVPATVFVTSGAIGSRREFWWDELDRVLLQPGTLPGELRLRIGGTEQQWTMDGSAEYSEATAHRHRTWRANDALPSSRHSAYLALCTLLRGVDVAERQRTIDQLVAWAGLAPEGRDARRPLTAAELQRLADGGLIEIGAHTVSHPALSSRPTAEQEDEICRSKANLEQILGSPVTSFAYPFGGTSMYTSRTVELVREAGFACACTTTPGAVSRFADPYQLRRMYVYDWDGERFARMLSRHLRIKGI